MSERGRKWKKRRMEWSRGGVGGHGKVDMEKEEGKEEVDVKKEEGKEGVELEKEEEKKR